MSFNVAEAVRERRLASGLSKAGFARKAKITRAALDQYEQGRRSPRVDTLSAILDVTADRLAIEETPAPAAGVAGLDLASFVAELDLSDPMWCWRSLTSDFVANEFLPALGAERSGLVAVEPDATGSRSWDAFVAALAEHVCFHGEIDTPRWMMDPARGPLDSFWWPVHGGLPSTRAAARSHSPAAFARRCILIDGRELPTIVP